MKQQRRVVWAKGMFLTPQHFQVQDDHFEDALQHRFAASLFCNWGFTRLTVDETSLSTGLFRLTNCSGFFRDGLSFDLPDTDDLPTARPVEQHFPSSSASLDVYLGVPERQWNAHQFTLAAQTDSAAGTLTRYTAETLPATDQSGTETRDIQVARKNVRILFGTQHLDGYTTLQIARLTRNGANGFICDSDFVPPCVDISASDFLIRLLRRQIELLVSKQESLASARRQRGASLADFNVSEVGSFWLLHTINSWLPLLRHIWSVRHGHPEAMYAAMLQLAGGLSTFALDTKPQEFPDYQHDNLSVCFSSLDEKIRTMLDTVIPTRTTTIPLRTVDQSTWTGTITDERLLRNTQFVLAVSSPLGVDEIIRKVPQLVKAACLEELDRLIRRALPGITLRHAPTPPSGISFRLHNQYFLLNQSGRLWDDIVRTRTIAFFVPSDIPEPKLELLVITS